MPDYFVLLNEPRRPWLDADSLKQKFLTLSAEAHPDRVHVAGAAEKLAAQERYVELNAAYSCLREPKERLRQLLELELGAKPKDVQRIPSDLMDLSIEVGRVCRETDVLLAGKSKVTSPLLKVQMFERSQEWVEKLNSLRQKISDQREQLIEELKAMNPAWESASATADLSSRRLLLPLERLEQVYRLLSYFDRWSAQIQERVVQLSF